MRDRVVTLAWFLTIHLAVVPAIGWSDYLCGPSISLFLFYLVPISATAWWFGRLPALFTSVESAIVAFTADVLGQGPEDLPVTLWNTVTRVVLFLLAGSLFARLRPAATRGGAETDERDELRRGHEQLRLLLDGIRERAVMMLDTDGGILLANEGSRRLRGYSPYELVGRSFWTLGDGRPDAATARGWLAGAAEIGSCEFEAPERRKDGSRFWSAGVISPLRDEDGRLRGYSLVTQDVSRQRETEAQVRELTARLISAQEEERRHLARELHDEVGAVLTCVRMSLEGLARRCGPQEDLQRAQEAVGQALEQVRRLSGDLRPSVLDDLGVVPALRWYLDKRARGAGLTTHFEAWVPEERLEASVEITCFRIVQEAVTNVLRHSGAKTLWVALERDGTELRICVRDDGRGFEPATARGLGLSAMSERAALVGGSMQVRSTPGGGTEVRAVLPLAPAAPAGSAA